MKTDFMFDTFEEYESDMDLDEELDADERTGEFVVRIKQIGDGAQSLVDLADMLRDYAALLDSLEEDGFQLSEPIINGQGFAYREGA